MDNWEDKFTEAMAVFSSILTITAKMAPKAIETLDVQQAREMIGQVVSASSELNKVLETRPPRILSPEEYEAKVASGNKITFTRDEKPQ